jgi:hypothetical protein
MNCRCRLSGENGTALIITLLALFLFTVLGLYMTLNATTGLYISDNFESRLQATYAALAGLNHARALIRGLAHDDLLKGPDGAYDPSVSYMNRARSFGFRNPLSLEKALSLDIDDPSNDVKGISDDGLINTGFCDGMHGKELIPVKGIGLSAPNPYNPGAKLLSRYFVRITDNNGESSEIEGDLNDNPFSDGDGTVILRSLGVARTIPQATGSASRLNSTAIFEVRLKRPSTWNVGPAVVILGSTVNAAFSGVCDIAGDIFPGIGTIDTMPKDIAVPEDIIRISAEGFGIISGGGYPNPSVKEISSRLNSNPDQLLLLDPKYLWDFVHNRAPKAADIFFEGSQSWMEANTPYLGSYDCSKPLNAPGQDPKITVVNGNLHVTGGFSGGGLLVVTGDFSVSGPFAYNGLVLVVGAGKLSIDGSGEGIAGGLFVASLENHRGEIVFGTPSFSISGRSRFSAQRDAVKMAIGLLPASQISFREITNSDP